jgi:hypothetical protein
MDPTLKWVGSILCASERRHRRGHHKKRLCRLLGDGTGAAKTACFTVTLEKAPGNVYEVTLQIVGKRYTGSGTTVFTVFDPSAGFASVAVGSSTLDPIIVPTTAYT